MQGQDFKLTKEQTDKIKAHTFEDYKTAEAFIDDINQQIWEIINYVGDDE